MKAFLIIILALILIIALFIDSGITGLITLREIENREIKKLGYCPSMLLYAQENYIDFEFIEYPNTAQVLQALNFGLIDYALIGRMPMNYEFNGECEMLAQGFTLIGNEKRFIDYSMLENMKICTYLSKEIAQEILPNSKKIHYFESIDEALECIESAILIDWKDYNNKELIVPYVGKNKVMEFRIPVIYHQKI